MSFWVRMWKLGLGFGTGEERREERKWCEPGLSLLYRALDRVGSDPIQRPTSSTVRFRSYWIRINPTPLMRSGDPDPLSCVGLGFITVGFGFLAFFLNLLLCTPLFLPFGPHVHPNFFTKIQKLLYVLGVCDCFLWYFCMLKLIKLSGVNFSLDWCILCFFSEFSCMIF